MIGVVLIFGPPLVIASVMLSPQGLSYTLDCLLRYAGAALLLFPIFAWPTFLIQAAAPLPGQSRFRAIIGLWLGGAVLLSAVMNLLGSMGDYSSHNLAFNPSGHTLVPYNPRAGLYLGTFTLCMLLGSGSWGAVARIVPVQFVLRAAIVTGLLLFGAVVGLSHVIWPQQSSSSALGQPAFPRVQEYASTVPKPEHVTDVDGHWEPEDGYEWVLSERELRVEWKPGLASSRFPHVIASPEEGRWQPADGYNWADPERSNDSRVKPALAR